MAMRSDLLVIEYTAIAFLLGWAIGYERFFRGRAAGTQVYCLVCMASCAVTSAAGLGDHWFGRVVAASDVNAGGIVAALLTGIGFLGAGVIVKGGASIRGLTTAASIWSSSAVGILVGVQFVGAALTLVAMYMACMAAIPRLERRLPGRMGIVVTLRYREGARPHEQGILAFMKERGLSVEPDTISVAFDGTRYNLEFQVYASGAERDHSLTRIADELPDIHSVESFNVTRTSRA
jgi:putative Mg2+ transporter-C (MgtC) family protein